MKCYTMCRTPSCWWTQWRRQNNGDYNPLLGDDLEHLGRDPNTVDSVLAAPVTTLTDAYVSTAGIQLSAALYVAAVSARWDGGWRITYRSKGSEGKARSMTAFTEKDYRAKRLNGGANRDPTRCDDGSAVVEEEDALKIGQRR